VRSQQVPIVFAPAPAPLRSMSMAHMVLGPRPHACPLKWPCPAVSATDAAESSMRNVKGWLLAVLCLTVPTCAGMF
jgi:hypothetical protein